MTRWLQIRRSFLALGIAGLAALPSLHSALFAEPAASTRPALEELDREVRELYRQAGGSFVHVQAPPPRWARAYAMQPINKYQQISPELRRLLSDQQRLMQNSGNNDVIQRGNVYINLSDNNNSATAPTTQNATNQQVGNQQQLNTIVVSPAAPNQPAPPDAPGGPLENPANTPPDFAPTQTGLLLDDKGHVLVPLYVEAEACAENPVRLAGPDGRVVAARFVGSDRQTNLSVVQIDAPAAKPLSLGGRPDEGSVCLFISPIDGTGHLGIWSGRSGEFGYVLSTDGRVAGLARYGQLLDASACRTVAEQIERFGMVRRPVMGLVVREMRSPDPRGPEASAMRVDAVLAGSAAARAGLKPGDLLSRLEGAPVNDIPSLAAAVAGRDGPAQLEIVRDNVPMKLTIDLVLEPVVKK